jgi:hypothetical protein
MPSVRFEPTTPAFERAKTVHPLDRAATVIGQGITLHLGKKFKVVPVLNQLSITP